MEVIDWSPERDSSIKEKEFLIHEKYHEALVEKYTSERQVFNSFRKFRIHALNRGIKHFGSLSGDVLEIGAGDGWCSAYVLKNYKVNSIHTMEITEAATNRLIPHVFDICGVDKSRATLIRGSFNQIDSTDAYDHILSMGAIHHSENLQLTLDNVYNALKPGGVFIAQEPGMIDSTPNSFYHSRNEKVANFKKIVQVTNKERSDIFYRKCEYLTAAYHSGFEVHVKWIFPQNRWYRRLLNIDPKLETNKANNLLLVLRKPEGESPYCVTRW